ncbi:hypothetical protein TWF718_004919 [Orbilia javanica]|uniref:Uncharacterized protein n=1 Tax=Orbilia javanica TaxID=47235 RepID=A0AAN8RLH5_9PEZI
MATSSTSKPPPPPITKTPKPAVIIDSVPTIDISPNAVIRKKVAQCLSILQIPTSTSTSTSTTDIPNQPSKKNPSKKAKQQKIIALRSTHPSAGSKTITIAEIVKRCIADSSSDGSNTGGKGVWWQYTKLESKLIELPPRKPIVVKEEEVPKKDGNKPDKDNDQGKSNPKATTTTTNANKRKQDGSESRASKRPKLDPPQDQHIDSTSPASTPKPNPRKRRRHQPDDADEGSDEDGEEDEEDDIPPHLRDNNGLESDGDIPPHLKDATDNMDTDDVPPHLRQSSPVDVPPHLRDSTPGIYSDTKPGFLRDSTPGNGHGGSDDIPPHLRGSSPYNYREGSSTPKPMVSQAKSHPLISSPPAFPSETPKQAHEEEEEDENLNKGENPDSSSSDDDDDGYRRFTYLDIEHLPEKHTKRILEDIDEAERNRKKYRAIAIMTIYLSLEKRMDFEKLYGGQTNSGEKKREQEGEKGERSK